MQLLRVQNNRLFITLAFFFLASCFSGEQPSGDFRHLKGLRAFQEGVVSVLDSTVIQHLHSQLAKVKANPEINFGVVNIIFFSDFLQLPAVLNPDVYVNNNGLGYRLWRSLNGVVILTQQMRQARDPSYAALLSRCRMRKPTDDDIEKL